MNEESSIYKIVIDTNIWISFLIGKRLSRLFQYIMDERIVVITCNSQIIELSRVLEKPKIQKLVHSNQIIAFFKFLEEHAVIVSISTKTNMCRDPKDNYLLSLSIDAKAHYLVTGDDDLLILKQINSTSIVNFADFEAFMNIQNNSEKK
jgi:putative PIN family toxin of toxin-antitoxin system